MSRRSRGGQVHLVTQAHKPKSEDIGYRERRYLLMMGVRIVCFLVAILLWTQGAGWFAAIPAVGAIAIPYFAVVFANGGREPNDVRGFQEYQPNLPEPSPRPAGSQPHLRYTTLAGDGQQNPGSGATGPAGAESEPATAPSPASGRQGTSGAAQSERNSAP